MRFFGQLCGDLLLAAALCFGIVTCGYCLSPPQSGYQTLEQTK